MFELNAAFFLCLAIYATPTASLKLLLEPADRPAGKVLEDADTYASKLFRQELEELELEIIEEDSVSDYEAKIKLRKPFLWVHIHKAAGSTMCEMARANGERIVSPATNCNWFPYDDFNLWLRKLATFHMVGDIPAKSCQERLEAWRHGHATWGHIEHPLFDTDICPESFSYGVALRDPVKLAESMLNYFDPLNPWQLMASKEDIIQCVMKGNPDHCADAGVSSFYEQEGGNPYLYFDNVMVRALGGAEIMKLPFGGVNITHLNRVLDRLAKFDVVLRVEELSSYATQAKFRAILGWTTARLSSTAKQNHIKTFSFTDAEMEAVRQLNRYDYILYNHFGNTASRVN